MSQGFKKYAKYVKTEQEAEVLEALDDSGSIAGAANIVGKSQKTVRKHLRRVRDRRDKAISIRIGWIVFFTMVLCASTAAFFLFLLVSS